MNAHDLLVKAKELISDPNHWTQNSVARDINGTPCHSLSSGAVCWCSIGAIRKIDNLSFTDAVVNATYFIEKASVMNLGGAAAFNDENPHYRVMEMWDKAIELAKER